MNLRSNFIQQILALFLLFSSLGRIQSKCVNSSHFKYDLDELSSITGYHAVCSQHVGRTCCSRNNFEQLSRKISKVLGAAQLSIGCKRSLTNLLCMPCDGDVGQQLREGVCSNYCQLLFQKCSSDYFSMDSNNQLRGCRQDDIICSKLADIIAKKGPESVCQLFQQQPQKMNCWNGEISALIKGDIKAKEIPQSRYKKSTAKDKGQSKKHDKTKKDQAKKESTKRSRKTQPKQKIEEEAGWISESLQTYLSLFGFVVIVVVGLWLKKVYRKWKKQYRNRR